MGGWRRGIWVGTEGTGNLGEQGKMGNYWGFPMEMSRSFRGASTLWVGKKRHLCPTRNLLAFSRPRGERKFQLLSLRQHRRRPPPALSPLLESGSHDKLEGPRALAETTSPPEVPGS